MNAPHDLSPAAAQRPLPAPMLAALRARFGERLSTAEAVRAQHGRGESVYDAQPPEAVVFCRSTEEVAFVVGLADQHAVPVIPFGVGSSLEGHLLAVQGGVCIDLSGMDRIVQVNAEDLTVTVEAGVTREQ
ncbi:MAG: FAD-binding oxidoreductase, partial [Pseudomonadota bacterium]